VKTLVVAEHRGGELRGVTLELISVARELGTVIVAVIGPTPRMVVDAVDVEGVEEIVLVDGGVAEFDSDVYRRALTELLESRTPAITLLASTPDSMAYGAAVAAARELGFASDVHGLRVENGELVATRSFYGGKVDGDVGFDDCDGVVLLVRQAVWPAAAGRGGAERTSLAISGGGPSRTRHLEFLETGEGGDVDITRAPLILAVGRGIGERENLELFDALADKMGATLAVSRPLVDAGWAAPVRQVGQSGKTVKPKVYLAFGISGASQHLAGMRSSETIVAVNNDAGAAIFTVADYGGVFDAVELARELEKLYP
jgi:electron transfer flavoprotein alpha subunit